jgi:hypothetical protein
MTVILTPSENLREGPIISASYRTVNHLSKFPKARKELFGAAASTYQQIKVARQDLIFPSLESI